MHDRVPPGMMRGEKTRFNNDTLTEITYAEKTWTLKQSIKDLFQNHLDAQMRAQVDSAIRNFLEDSENQLPALKDLELRKVAYQYLSTKGHLSSDAEMEMAKEFIRCVGKYSNLPQDAIADLVLEKMQDLEFKPPVFKYLVQDRGNKNPNTRLVTISELNRLHEKLGHGNYRWQIVGLLIQDDGPGYDVTLKSVYDSDKRGAVDQVGRFGEGAKISDAFLVNNGYQVIQKSLYTVEGEDGYVAWKSRPEISSDGRLAIRGITIKSQGTAPTGSSTLVRFPDGERDLSHYLDPRNHNGALPDFMCLNSKNKFYYPYYSPNQPLVGVMSRNTYLATHFIGGIAVEDLTPDNHTIFNYSILDAGAVAARDRNKLSQTFASSVNSFWRNQPDPKLFRQLFQTQEPRNQKDGIEVKSIQEIIEDTTAGRSKRPEVAKIFIHHLRECCSKNKKTIFVSTPNSLTTNEQDSLESHGYTIVRFYRIKISNELIKTYLGDVAISLDEARAGLTSGLVDKNQDGWQERLEFAQTLYKEAIEELEKLYGRMSNHSQAHLVRTARPIYHSKLYSSEPVDFVFDTKTGANQIRINIEQLNFPKEKRDAIKRLIQVNLIAILNGTSQAKNDTLQKGQQEVGLLLTSVMQQHVPSEFKGFNHQIDTTEAETIFWKKRKKEIKLAHEQSQIYFQLFQESVNLDFLKGLPDRLDHKQHEQIINILVNKLFITEAGLATFVFDDEKKCLKLIQGKIDGLPIVYKDSKRVIRKFGNILILKVQDLDYVKIENEVCFESGGLMYRSSILSPLSAELDTAVQAYQLRFSKNYAYMCPDPKDSPAYVRDIMLAKIENCEFHYKKTDSPAETQLESGLVGLPLSVEYGQENWNNPLRFLEDVAQNHLDAGTLTISYYVQTANGQKSWVNLSEISESDQILGVEFEDNGSGYAPESARIMGKTTKHNPLEAGKYGEGIKMFISAACRNLVDLEIESTCLKNGHLVRWQGRARTVEKEVVKSGQRQITHLAGFELAFDTNTKLGSKTRIVFKDPTSDFSRRCIEALYQLQPGGQPKGLDRYIRQLRSSHTDSNVLRVGPVSYLPDETGTIYENGLFLKDGSNLYLGGYDTPSVSNTRERNEANEAILTNYLVFLLGHTTNLALIEKIVDLVVRLKDHPDSWDEKTKEYLDIKVLAQYTGQNFPNLGLYLTMADQKLSGGYFSQSNLASERHLDSEHAIHFPKTGLVGEMFPSSLQILSTYKELPVKLKTSEEAKVHSLLIPVVKLIESKVLSGEIKLGGHALSLLKLWQDKTYLHTAITYRRSGSVDGQAHDGNRISLSEGLLAHGKEGELLSVFVHELVHILTGGKDYTPEFMASLLDIVLNLRK